MVGVTNKRGEVKKGQRVPVANWGEGLTKGEELRRGRG